MVLGFGAVLPNNASAQRLYSGSSFPDAQYSGGSSIDSTGRAANAEGRAVDRYGHVIDDYGRLSGPYRVPSYAAGGSYYPGGYSGLGYMNGIGYSVGVGGYSGGYYSVGGRFGAGSGVGSTYIAPPRTVVVGGVYNARTVMNNSTRGGVVEYTNNGNGYIYSPGTSNQTVISTGPSIFPSVTVVQPAQPAALIETRPMQATAKTFGRGSASTPVAARSVASGEVQLIFPPGSAIPFSYSLNGTVYTIKPGYSQTFLDDRIWTIEFLRGGAGSQPMRYELKAGTYQFAADENGWDLKQVPVTSVATEMTLPAPALPPLSSVPQPVAAPTPSPDL